MNRPDSAPEAGEGHRSGEAAHVGGRLFGYLVCVLVLAATLWPLTWPRGRDSFPLSSYPMFSRKLPTATFSSQYTVAVDGDGGRHHLPPEMIANEEVLQASVVLRRAVHTRRAGPLCREVARRVAASSRFRQATVVKIVTGRHDAVAYLRGSDRVGDEKVHARCAIRRDDPTRGGTQ